MCLVLFCSNLILAEGLERGHVELAALAGGALDTSSIFNGGKAAFGGQVAVGVNRHLAGTFNYVAAKHDQGVCFFLCPPPDRTLHELMGGARFSLPNETRFTPYLSGTAGLVRTTSASFATGVGVGVDVRAAKRFGMLVDLRGLYAVSPQNWIVRGTAGIYVRF